MMDAPRCVCALLRARGRADEGGSLKASAARVAGMERLGAAEDSEREAAAGEVVAQTWRVWGCSGRLP